MIEERCARHVRQMPLLAALDEATYRKVIELAEYRNLKRGEAIFQTGEPADRFYMLCNGRAKIYLNTIDGREQILYVYGEQDFIGGLNLLMSQNYLYNGTALEECCILVIPASAFHRYMVNNASVLRVLLEQSFERIRWAESLVERLSQHTAQMKTAALILRLVHDIGVPTEGGYILKLSMNREELGSFAGLTRESITRTLNDLRTLGYIDWYDPQTILVTGFGELRRILGS